MPLFKYIIRYEPDDSGNSSAEDSIQLLEDIKEYFKEKIIDKDGVRGIIFIENKNPVLFIEKHGKWGAADQIEDEEVYDELLDDIDL